MERNWIRFIRFQQILLTKETQCKFTRYFRRHRAKALLLKSSVFVNGPQANFFFAARKNGNEKKSSNSKQRQRIFFAEERHLSRFFPSRTGEHTCYSFVWMDPGQPFWRPVRIIYHHLHMAVCRDKMDVEIFAHG